MAEKKGGMVKRMARLFNGDLIIIRGIERNMGLVFYVFVLLCAIITWSLYVEKQLVKVEHNKELIEALEVSSHQRNIELVSLDQRTRIEKMLAERSSRLKAPEEPAKVVAAE